MHWSPLCPVHVFSGCMAWGEEMNGHSSECGRVNPKILLTDLYVFSPQRQKEAWLLRERRNSSHLPRLLLGRPWTDLCSRINLQENTFYFARGEITFSSPSLASRQRRWTLESEADRKQRDTGAATNRSSIHDPGRQTGIGPRVPPDSIFSSSSFTFWVGSNSSFEADNYTKWNFVLAANWRRE